MALSEMDKDGQLKKTLILGGTILLSTGAYAQTAVGTWTEREFTETYIRQDFRFGHVLYERFNPQLNQFTLGLGYKPSVLEGQARFDDLGSAWAGFKVNKNFGQTSVMLRPLIGLNRQTPNWCFVTVDQRVHHEWGGKLYLLGKTGRMSDMYLGPTFSKGNVFLWVGFGLNDSHRFVINLHAAL